VNRPSPDSAIRFFGALSLALLSAITGVVSYLHALAICRVVGNGAPVAYLIPFVPDLMIVTASLTILDAARKGEHWPPTAIAALVVGIGSTVAMNVAAGWRTVAPPPLHLAHVHAGSAGGGISGALVAALAPLAFVLTFETLMVVFRSGGRKRKAAADPATSSQCPHQVAMSGEEAVVTAFLHGRDCLGDEPSQRGLSTTFGVPRPRVASLVSALNGDRPPDPGEPPPET
jgi:hypothetical protein